MAAEDTFDATDDMFLMMVNTLILIMFLLLHLCLQLLRMLSSMLLILMSFHIMNAISMRILLLPPFPHTAPHTLRRTFLPRWVTQRNSLLLRVPP